MPTPREIVGDQDTGRHRVTLTSRGARATTWIDDERHAGLMDSGAGHDAMQVASIAKAGLLFVPSREGISHNPREYTSIEGIATGAQVLREATLRLAARHD